MRTGVILLLLMAAVASAERVPVLVELFTSEGCSSCPPADLALIALEKHQPVSGAEIIVLSQHVDYWDRLGWRDPFSSSELTARQGEYARAFRTSNIYTPQMVVHGQAEFVGSDTTRARREIERAAAQPQARVSLELTANGTLSMIVSNIPSPGRGDQFDVYLAITETGLANDVLKGENEGSRLQHTGVVRSMMPVAALDPSKQGRYTAEAKLNIRSEWKRANCRAVVFVQERHSRRIVGASSTKL